MIFQTILQKSFAQNFNRIAIEGQHTLTTYSSLLRKANAVTNFLITKGTAKESYICVQTDDRELLITAMIGIMNAGCVFVPVSSAWPVKRLAYVLEQTNPAWIFSTGNNDQGMANHVSLKAILEDIALQNTPQYPEYNEDDSIYLYFTSGSTGTPKGIIGRNKSLLQYLQWQINEFKLDNTVKVSQLISPYFDAFLRDVFIPLLTGGVICLPPADEDLLTPVKLKNWLVASEVSLVHCVPSVFRIINEAVSSGDSLFHLKWIMMSGEKINPAELRSWYQLMGERIGLVNLYGATETTMIRSSYVIKPADALKSNIPVGPPISDTRFFILNANGKPCPKYIPGELYIATSYLSKGYFNDPELTREKFVELFKDTPDACTAFKTGDTARFMEQGQIELLGRTDRQVKIRGIRADLNEIENVLLNSGLLKNVIVLQPGNTADNTEQTGGLNAYVISKGEVTGMELNNSLFNYAKDYIADYLIPAQIIEVNTFPLLQNGKVDYLALMTVPKPETHVLPANETEAKLLLVWKEMLGDKEISTTDTFQKMGGSSLSMMRLIARIYKDFSVRVSLKDLFSNLTIQKQAALILATKRDEIFRIEAVEPGSYYSTSSTQKRIYFEQKRDSQSTAYNLPMAWSLAENVDLNKLKSALKALFNRHESLRTRFRFQNNDIYQFIDNSVTLEIQELHVNTTPALNQFIQPFDMASDTLFRCTIIHINNGLKLLFIDIHHIVCDGMSQALLFTDLLKLYDGITLSPIAIQYKDYAAWEQKFKLDTEYQKSGKFWHNTLNGDLPKLAWPVHITANNDKKGDNHFFEVEEKLAASLTILWQQSDVTLFSGFLAAYNLFLNQFVGQDDIIIGINSTGRLQSELENVVGMFAKTLPIRFQTDFDADCRSYFENTQQLLNAAFNSQVYDYLDIVGDINNAAGNKHDDIFETMFVFQDFGSQDVNADGGLFTGHSFDVGMVKYPLSLFMHQTGNGSLRFRVEYQTAYFTAGDIKLLTTQFVELLEAIAANFNAPVKDCLALDELPDAAQTEDHFRF